MIGLKAITPRNPIFNNADLRRILERELDDLARDQRKDFEKTAENWEDKPVFTIEKMPFRRAIYTDHAVWNMLNAGTRAHSIRASKSRLVFQANYVAKTSPRVIGSTSGGPYGPTVYARVVRHPGTEPREWDVAINEKWENIIPRRIQAALNDGLDY